MLALPKKTKIGICIIIILISLIYTLRKVDLLNETPSKREVKEFKSAINYFNNTDLHIKSKFKFQTDNISDFSLKLDNFLTKYSPKVIFSSRQSEYLSYVVEFPDSIYNNSIQQFRSIGQLIEENSSSVSSPNDIINIEEHIKNNEMIKKRLQSQLEEGKQILSSSIPKYHTQINNIQTKIDSLQILGELVKYNKTHHLVYFMASLSGNSESGKFGKYFVFGKTFFITLILAFCFGILLYFIIAIGLKIMDLIGIKTNKRSTRNAYKYSEYSKKSKNKRIYKNIKDEQEKR